jgi:hypothetical protein
VVAGEIKCCSQESLFAVGLSLFARKPLLAVRYSQENRCLPFAFRRSLVFGFCIFAAHNQKHLLP